MSPQKLPLTQMVYEVTQIQEEGERQLLNSSLVPITLYLASNLTFTTAQRSNHH